MKSTTAGSTSEARRTSASVAPTGDGPPGGDCFPPQAVTISAASSAHSRLANLLRRHAEQPAGIGVFGYPQRAVRRDLDVASAMADVPPFGRLRSAFTVEGDAVEGLR